MFALCWMKMSQTQAESVIKNISGEIVKECDHRGHVVSETLASFMVEAVLLDPGNGFDVSRTLTEQDVQKVKELSLGKLTEECSPQLDTVKMQLYFDMNYTSRRELLEKIHQALESQLIPMSREITDSRVKTREEMDALYHQIVIYILLQSAMGSPSDVKAVQEAAAALQSVFPQTELGAFSVLSKKDKEQQLRELTMIVTGIRLFNEACRKGEEEFNVEDLMPASLKEALQATTESIKKELSVTQSVVWKYTAVLEELTCPDSQSQTHNVPVVLLRRALYNVRQHEVFLKTLHADACSSANHVDILQTELSAQLKLLRETVQSKSAIPTSTVFPLFKALSKLWSGFQDEAALLNIISNVTLNLQPFLASQAEVFPEVYLDDLLETAEVKTDEQRMAESSDEQVSPAQMKTREWLLAEETVSFDELPLQYNGFCGYTLVKRDGLLLPGNPCIGTLKHRGNLFAFSSKEAALSFASCPDDFVSEVADKSKRFPELLRLLRLHHQPPCTQPEESVLETPSTMSETGTQTDIHPVETNIDRSYEWNEWELRRKAVRLADLRTKVTHKVQTDLSHMRRDNFTQTWLSKDAQCQSRKVCGSNVPKPQTYLAGLRGSKTAHVIKTNLTRPVDE